MSALDFAGSAVAAGLLARLPRTFRAAAPLVVPPGGLLDIPIDVHGIEHPVARLVVAVRLTHESVGLIALSMASPGGTWVALSTFNGGQERCFGAEPADPVVFDERAEMSIVDAAAPISGAYRPEGPLGRYRLVPLEGLNGRWHLLVGDAGHQRGAPAQVLAAAFTFEF